MAAVSPAENSVWHVPVLVRCAVSHDWISGIGQGARKFLKLGRYEVVRELGKGAMGVVYLAKDPLIGRLVALKTIRPASAVDDDEAKEFQQRFLREAQAAGILSHPAIVTVHDIGQDAESGVSFIAMEYVEGQNLKEFLSQGKSMPPAEVAEILAQIAEALDFAHAKGIVHRDVKPANIMLCGESRAKITDFGIAKIASISANLTTTGQFLGTPNYMAPEQVKGTRVDGRTDIFSLGIVLYETLVRRKPFGGDSLTSISYKIVHEGYTPVTDIDPSLPDGLDTVIRRSLAKDPGQRYQRAKDLAIELRAAAQGAVIPKKVGPVNFEQTVMGEEKIPTIEIPFPDAHGGVDAGAEPEPFPEASPRKFSGSGSVPTRPGAGRRPVLELKQFLRPLQRPIPTAVFLGVILALLVSLVITGIVIDRQKVPLPDVDEKREALVARQRTLRTDADVLLRQGDIEGAYKKYQELRQIAPNSPTIRNILIRLDQIRVDQLSYQQRMSQAKATYEKGMQLYDQKNYAGAIPLFEEAFHLNPTMTEAVNFLRMTREQLALQDMKSNAGGSQSRSKGARTGTSSGKRASQEAPADPTPASLVTIFESPVNSGYVLVKANGDSLVYENLWEERKSGLLRRKIPRSIHVTKQVKPGVVDIEVWVVIPSMNLQEHRQLQDTFAPGAQRTLTVTLDKSKKRVVVTLS